MLTRKGFAQRRFEIEFGQIYLSRPTMTESDGTVAPMFPNEARLRNLTYSAPLYVEMSKRTLLATGGYDQDTGEPEYVQDPDEEGAEAEPIKVYIGKVRARLGCCAFRDGHSPQSLIASHRYRSCCDHSSACCTNAKGSRVFSR